MTLLFWRVTKLISIIFLILHTSLQVPLLKHIISYKPLLFQRVQPFNSSTHKLILSKGFWFNLEPSRILQILLSELSCQYLRLYILIKSNRMQPFWNSPWMAWISLIRLFKWNQRRYLSKYASIWAARSVRNLLLQGHRFSWVKKLSCFFLMISIKSNNHFVDPAIIQRDLDLGSTEATFFEFEIVVDYRRD